MKAANGDKNVAKMHDENQRGIVSRRNERCKPAFMRENGHTKNLQKRQFFKEKYARLRLSLVFYVGKRRGVRVV